MAKLIWSRNMTRDRLHESEDKRKDLIDFYDYDELLETLDDDQVDDLIDSDERMPAMDNAYYDEDVRPKIEAQTLDGIVLLVERPEEEEEEPEEGPEVEESLNESEDEEEEASEEEEVDDELPELEGLAILADEIPEEFPDAKIVDDGDGFVLEDGDTKYDMYAIPEDKVEEFMDKCMDDPMEDVMDEDEEFESDMELDVDSINDNCDFSMVPEVCERITGEPEEEVDSVEDDLGDGQGEPKEADDLKEATLKPESKDAIVKEAEELKKKSEEYGIDYFTSMPFSEYDNDPISFEHQFPNVAKIWRSFMKEVLDIDPKDDDQVDEIWDTDIDQTDWNTVMKVIDKMVDRINKNGESTSFQITKEYTNQANANKKDDKPKDELVDDEYSESLEESAHPFVNEGVHDSWVEEWWGQTDESPDEICNEYNLDCEQMDARDDEALYRFSGSLEDIKRAINDGYFYSVGIEYGKASDDVMDWLEHSEDKEVKKPLFVIKDKHGNQVSRPSENEDELWDRVGSRTDLKVVAYNESLDEAMTITEAPHQDEYGYIDDDAEGITPDEAKEDIDDFLDGEISIEAFRDFDNDDKELGKEEWIRQMIEFNFDADDLIQDWYENYNANSVEKIENEARDYFDDKARALLSQVWDHYAGVKEDLITDSEPSEESVDPDDNLTEAESDAWPWGDPGPLN